MATLETKTRAGINLLPEELRIPGKFKTASRFLSRWSVVVSGFYIFILLLLFATSLLFSRQEEALRVKNASLSREAENLKGREGLLAIVKNRASLAQTVFTKSPQIQNSVIDNLISSFPAGTQVSDIASENGNTEIKAVAANSEVAKEIFAKVEGANAGQVTLTSLSLEPNGGYSFSLEVK